MKWSSPYAPMALFLLSAQGLQAQSVSYLDASPLESAAGSVRIRLMRERGPIREQVLPGERAATRKPIEWPESGPPWLFVRAAGGQENYGYERPFPRAEGALVLHLAPAEATVVGAELAPRIERLEAAELLAFLRERIPAAHWPADLAAQSPSVAQRVRRLESLELIVRAELAPAPPSGSAQSKTGQAAQIRPYADPTRVPLGSDLPFRVYLPGELEGGLVLAQRPDGAAPERLELGPGGIGRVTLDRLGRWSLEAHVLRRPAPAAEGGPRTAEAVDWELVSTTLVFELRSDSERQEQKR